MRTVGEACMLVRKERKYSNWEKDNGQFGDPAG